MMIAATVPAQRPSDAKLLVADRRGQLQHRPRRELIEAFRAGDLVVANDALTIPASLSGRHVRTGRRVEVRLAGCQSLDVQTVTSFAAVLFGLGDFRTRTEDRRPPPPVEPGDRLALGPLAATVTRRLHEHPRLVEIAFDGGAATIWEGIARHGRPIQYAHLHEPLALWDTWTPIAGAGFAFEPPSAGFALDWRTILSMRTRGIRFATITHAAGLSSTGDPELDARLPLDEPYRIPKRTAEDVRQARAEGRRVVAIGTTVVRALEHSAGRSGIVRPGDGLATGRIGPSTRLLVVDAMLSGTHERGSSHYELLRAFAEDETLDRIDRELEVHGYRTHEFGDSVLLEHMRCGLPSPTGPGRFCAGDVAVVAESAAEIPA